MTTHTSLLGTPFLPTVQASRATACHLALPPAEDRLRHGAHCWAARLRDAWAPHRLRAADGTPVTAEVPVTDTALLRWHTLFGTAPRSPLPYPAHHGGAALLQQRLVHGLGLQLRHLAHVRHATELAAGALAMADERRPRLHCSVRRCLRIGEDRALLELQTLVQGHDGTLLSTTLDGYVVRRLAPADVAALPADRATMRDLIGLRRRLPELALSAVGVQTCWLPLAPGLAGDWRRAAGRAALPQAAHFGGRLPGARHGCLSAWGLYSLLLGPLHAMGLPLDHLTMTCTAPAALDCTLALVVQAPRWELQDERGGLVAYGTCNAGDTGDTGDTGDASDASDASDAGDAGGTRND